MTSIRYCGVCGRSLVPVGDESLCVYCYEEHQSMAKKKSKSTKQKKAVPVKQEEKPRADAPRLKPVYASPTSDKILGWRTEDQNGQELFTTWVGDERPEGYQEPQTSMSDREVANKIMQQRTDEVVQMIDKSVEEAIAQKDLGPATDLEGNPWEGKFLVEILKVTDTPSDFRSEIKIWHCDKVNLTEQEAKERMFQLKEELKLEDEHIRYVPMSERYRRYPLKALLLAQKKSEAVPIHQHEGKKYLRKIRSCVTGAAIEVDVYDVLAAFDVQSQPIGQAIKKLLACGQRGKGDKLADLKGVLAAVNRAIQQEEQNVHV